MHGIGLFVHIPFPVSYFVRNDYDGHSISQIPFVPN